jgi:hypothetical protein
MRRRSVSNLRLYHGIFLEGRRKAKKTISENSLSEAKNEYKDLPKGTESKVQ